jgi:hypothetical protein
MAHRQRLFLIVGDVEERRADEVLDAAQLEVHRLAQLEIEGGERLVEEQYLRVVDQRPGQGDALRLAP